MERGLHTLCLLDIKVKEQTEENMMRCVFFFFLIRRIIAIAEIVQFMSRRTF